MFDKTYMKGKVENIINSREDTAGRKGTTFCLGNFFSFKLAPSPSGARGRDVRARRIGCRLRPLSLVGWTCHVTCRRHHIGRRLGCPGTSAAQLHLTIVNRAVSSFSSFQLRTSLFRLSSARSPSWRSTL